MIVDTCLCDTCLAKLRTIESAWFLYLADTPFYLTGSRYFGCARPDSDWDFIAQYSGPLTRYLEANGFTPRTHIETTEGGMERLVYDNTEDNISGHRLGTQLLMERDDVQIQLVRVPDAKRYARDQILKNHAAWHYAATTPERTKLWNIYLHMYAILNPELAPFADLTPIDEL